MRTPVRIALISLTITQVLNLLLVSWMEHAGLALSIGLASCINAWMLYRGLRQNGVYTPNPGWHKFIAKLGLAVAAMAIMLLLVVSPDAWWLQASLTQKALQLAYILPLSLLAYFGTLFALGFRPKDFRRA